MRIIDFHTHYYPEKIAARALDSIAGILTPSTDGSRRGLLESMRRAGVSRSVALPLVNTPANARGVNLWAGRENYGDITMLGSFHPDQEDIPATLKLIAGAGLPGIKLHPEYQLFRFSEKRLDPVWELCIELDLFVLTHAGADIKFSPPFRSNPAELAAFHRRHPRLKLVLAHFGGYEMWEEAEAELLGLPVYLDLAMIGPEHFRPEKLAALIRRHGADRVLFGSDSPWNDQLKAVEFIRQLPLNEEEFDRIFHRNAAGLLNLKASIPA